jgi:DNA-binding transcriptional MerR regulator
VDTIARQKGVNAVRPASWKVGRLAKQTGLSVRTLHYYEEIGLLSPSRRTEAGHRLYAASDVVRLQQITSLRQLGFTLKEIRAYLNRPNFSAQRVIQLHILRLREQIELQQKLCDRLEAITAGLRSAKEIPTEKFIQTAMEVISMSERLEKYYTPEQLEFNGGDSKIERSLGAMWRQERTIHGIDTSSMRDMMEYVSKAASKKAE